MYRRLLLPLTCAGVAFFVGAGWADVPPPPVNQAIGMPDVLLGSLTEADCRACHDSGVPDRHHMLYGQPIPGESLVPYDDTDVDGNAIVAYVCLSCHGETFHVERDCTQCHGEESPHHATSAALAGDCVACHGDLVDNMDDGHYVPDYEPSLVTPTPSSGNGEPANRRGVRAGGCNYCHDRDDLDPPIISRNRALHHGTGLPDAVDCGWCHNFRGEEEEDIRTCEGCHGPDSLHNIQADSPDADSVGTIVVGGEDAGYGHIGRDAGPGDSDCWGCHGFSALVATAPRSGPVIPSIDRSDIRFAKAGTDVPVTIGGSGFSNRAGDLIYESSVRLTSDDGSTVNLSPDTISHDVLTVTIPGTTAPGNYRVQAIKSRFASNPTVISIVPRVTIADATVDGGAVTINGRGFGGFAAGSGTSVTASDTDMEGEIIEGEIVSWSDTTIVAEFASSPDEVTVSSVFGAATSAIHRGARRTFLRGDSNGDGRIHLADATYILDYLFLGGPLPSCPDASDIDDNARLDLTDAVFTLTWLFAGGGDLPSPGPYVCGPDPTEDALPPCDYDPAKC